MKLDIWDTAGQEVYGNMNRNYYAGSSAVIIVYAVDRLSSFKSLEEYYHNVKQLCAEDVIVAIAGHKCDLQLEKVVQFDDLESKAEELDCKFYFETSAIM